jgi:hypothetical protein
VVVDPDATTPANPNLAQVKVLLLCVLESVLYFIHDDLGTSLNVFGSVVALACG